MSKEEGEEGWNARCKSIVLPLLRMESIFSNGKRAWLEDACRHSFGRGQNAFQPHTRHQSMSRPGGEMAPISIKKKHSWPGKVKNQRLDGPTRKTHPLVLTSCLRGDRMVCTEDCLKT